ncbi:MAG TPA: succinate dehydrogenase cytochrome b subunit [Thermoanaerobaculia bacterium]|jgi:succinate dehydrogenase / fumarate reductase cytochrome b subunit|nr:succinate dehydrogenase cytochrome b subunit [Thermoanaerobaculia bacterium]
MSWFTDFTRSAVGKKAVMAVTGIILFGFVLVHMIGNLKLYEGQKYLDSYAGWLREVGSPAVPTSGLLWLARIVLIAAVVLHIWAAYTLTRGSQAARPHRYERYKPVHLSYASRTMRWGGVIIVLFVVYHLLHLTAGAVHPDFQEGNVYHNVVTGFQVWWVALFYIVAQVALGFHLYHGLWSLFQSLGWNHPRFNHWRRAFAHAFAWIITLGNISFPVAVLTGLVHL